MNIRNIRYPDRVYPSPVRLEARIFDKGRLTLEGDANFLQEPHIGVKAEADLEDMELAYFKPITDRQNITVRSGTLSAKGGLEYAPKITALRLKKLLLKGVDADYIHTAQTAAAEQERVQKAGQAAKQLSNEPTTKIRADVLTVQDSRFAYVNKTSNPNYRLFLENIQMTLKNFSNQFVEGPASLELRGKFMGSGETKVTGTFRPETKAPDFSVNIAIENTDMVAGTDLFRAYGKFDIQGGLMSFYSEMHVKGDRVEGYVKPLFKNMQVTDRRSDEEKSLFHKLYVGVVKGAAKLLENRPREQVATVTDISGPLSSPHADIVQVIIKLLQNAFIRAILPGFEREAGQAKK